MKTPFNILMAIFLFLPTAYQISEGENSMQNELTPIASFDLGKYLGKWYEIARLPAWFEKDMSNVTATYSLKKNGKVRVENAGIKNGKYTKAVGKAKLAHESNIGYLKVAFFLSFYADYKVIALDTIDYQYAVVASSSKYLWILCRKPHMDKSLLESLVQKAKNIGFDTSKLTYTAQRDDT
jgi:apolipoprotein D and lipocalin family protein